jgi:hypothetical protein
MKTTGIILTFLGILFIGLDMGIGIVGHYHLERDFLSYWSLADKSSTIIKKSEYLDKFVEALEKKHFEGKYNAWFLTTPDNSFDQNFIALKSLQQRLHEIKDMNVSSFEYQTAMQQITGQEQGEAADMISVFKGVWWKENHFLLWDWVYGVQLGLLAIVIIVGLYLWGKVDGWYLF